MEQYIPKSVLVAEITHKIKVLEAFVKNFDGISDKVEKAKNKIEVLGDVLLFIDTLEVKEMDLEKAIKNYMDIHHLHIKDGGRIVFENDDSPNFMCDFRDFAKHFFELGLKAQKGEKQ